MTINFNKYHGAGNDFIIIDNRKMEFIPGDSDLISRMCNRHLGIGADGLILIHDHPKYDFEMKYFNSDGRESTMCGNGGRCAVDFSEKMGIAGKESLFLASDGLHKALITGSSISISLKDVLPPVKVKGSYFLNTGSPHCIVAVPDVEKVDIVTAGKKIRWSDDFSPGGTNVNFVQPYGKGIKVRTYERGVENETLSCGTGVTASAISSRWGKGTGMQKVDVETRGGKLVVSFELAMKLIQKVCLTGAARFVFSGSIESDNLI
ncbi:MAG TPA: diaminopimelate epimerase [Bacteroidales bacterium]|nr:diaminopimelate epimerase [Bacteroidales bacterium]